MFLSNEYFKNTKITKLAMEESTFAPFYNYWLTQLFERVMRLFVWENTGNVHPKEIEQRLLMAGHCGIADYKHELTAFYGHFYGVTKYYDEHTHYTVHSPVYSGQKKIGKDIVVINNTSIRNAAYPLIHHYAMLLAHNEVSLIDAMVDLRDNSGIPIAQNENQRQSILNYVGKKFEGKFDVVMDPAYMGVDYKSPGSSASAATVSSLLLARKDILQAFYSDIGVRSAFEKKSNTVASEVEADTSLLLLNLSDMLAERQKGCDAVNDLFGTNWTVKIADEINYKEEIENDSAGIIQSGSDSEFNKTTE